MRKTTEPSLDAAVAGIVAEEVAAALAPYRPIFERMAILFSPAPARTAPKRAAPAKRTSARKPARRAAAPKNPAEDARAAKSFVVGQQVLYRQGRGSFPAKVVAVDFEMGELLLQRESDGKEVMRPALKVTLVEPAKPVRKARKEAAPVKAAPKKAKTAKKAKAARKGKSKAEAKTKAEPAAEAPEAAE